MMFLWSRSGYDSRQPPKFHKYFAVPAKKLSVDLTRKGRPVFESKPPPLTIGRLFPLRFNSEIYGHAHQLSSLFFHEHCLRTADSRAFLLIIYHFALGFRFSCPSWSHTTHTRGDRLMLARWKLFLSTFFPGEKNWFNFYYFWINFYQNK